MKVGALRDALQSLCLGPMSEDFPSPLIEGPAATSVALSMEPSGTSWSESWFGGLFHGGMLNGLRVGQVFEVAVSFNETMCVWGAPQVELRLGWLARVAHYRGRSGGETLRFTYVVTEDDVLEASLRAAEVSVADGERLRLDVEVGDLLLNGAEIHPFSELRYRHAGVARQGGVHQPPSPDYHRMLQERAGFRMKVDVNLEELERFDAYATASQGLRGNTGLGWRALGGRRNGSALAEGGLYLQGPSHLFTADVSSSSSQQALRLGTQGGLVLMDGRAFATRSVQDSFVLVNVPGLADVGVSFQGRERARTDDHGVALVTGLQPYSANQVRLNPSDVPLSAEIDSLEQVVVPRRRSAVTIGFAVRSGQAALITVRLQNGEPAPAGAEIEVPGDERRFPVGRGGQAFLTGLQREHLLSLHWKGASCQMPLVLTPTAPDDIARPSPLVCKGISP